VIIPLQCEYYALEGLAGLLETVDLVRRELNPGPRARGRAAHDGRRAQQPVAPGRDEVRTHFGRAGVHDRDPAQRALSEAPSHGKPILLYDVHSKGATAYLELARSCLQRLPAARRRPWRRRPRVPGRTLGGSQ
jgi:chromosome partitioning protein